MTDGSFLFARFADRRKLSGIEDKLQSLGGVARWDAVDGFFSLAVWLTDAPEADIRSIRALDGLTEAVESRIIAGSESKPADSDLCQAYVLVEADAEMVDEISTKIEKYEDTLGCYRTEGQYGLIVALQSTSFDRIDQTIDDRISSLDGVLRLKEGRIISSHVK
ncbi:MAG: hypothetical protein GY867_02385 [bacterium]|nr:hypothetical protein [bacterium]